MGLLDGKVAIITGAGGGIGRAHAHLFAKEGARVLVNDVGGNRDGAGSSDAAAKVVAEIHAMGGKAEADTHSVADVDAATALVAHAVSAFGGVDILVNNAGILRDRSALKLELSDWNDVISVHLTGTFLCSQAFLREAVKQGRGGRIVNTTSVSGLRGNFGQSNYAAAKAGIFGLTRTLSIEGQKHRITVNALAPIAKTRMTEDLPMFDKVDSMLPEHVSPAALFLASDLCGDRTGHVLAVSGGQMYGFKVIETAGRFKEDGAQWTAEEIAEHWDAIMKS